MSQKEIRDYSKRLVLFLLILCAWIPVCVSANTYRHVLSMSPYEFSDSGAAYLQWALVNPSANGFRIAFLVSDPVPFENAPDPLTAAVDWTYLAFEGGAWCVATVRHAQILSPSTRQSLFYAAQSINPRMVATFPDRYRVFFSPGPACYPDKHAQCILPLDLQMLRTTMSQAKTLEQFLALQKQYDAYDAVLFSTTVNASSDLMTASNLAIGQLEADKRDAAYKKKLAAILHPYLAGDLRAETSFTISRLGLGGIFEAPCTPSKKKAAPSPSRFFVLFPFLVDLFPSASPAAAVAFSFAVMGPSLFLPPPPPLGQLPTPSASPPYSPVSLPTPSRAKVSPPPAWLMGILPLLWLLYWSDIKAQ